MFAIPVFFLNLLFCHWYSDWNYRKAITNNYACGGDLTNFPLLVIISNDSDLINHASNNGHDIVFTLRANTNKLAHEIEYYSAGTIIAWIKMPYFSASEQLSNILYMYFDKTKPGNQQNQTAVWDNDYTNVYHLDEPGSDFTNSVKGTIDGSGSGTYTSAVSGVAHKALFAGSADGSINFISNARLSLFVPFIDNKIRMVPDDGNYQRIFTGNENRLTMASYIGSRMWIPVFSRLSDIKILPDLSYKIFSADLSDTGVFGVSVISDVNEYENKVTVKNRVFAPQSDYSAMSKVKIFFPNPAFEDVRLQIYRMDGQKVYERYASGAVSMVSWDGLADNGRMSDSGLYIAAITRGGRMKETYRVKIYLLK
ncbi:MAG: hypothetical protein A2096_09865 [Spirochaetes bacterium GWF1_41_5]|nr:MAG: hypothetical protein A2096_09865 [Spirochaetes bacterium GWF1_41_5]